MSNSGKGCAAGKRRKLAELALGSTVLGIQELHGDIAEQLDLARQFAATHFVSWSNLNENECHDIDDQQHFYHHRFTQESAQAHPDSSDESHLTLACAVGPPIRPPLTLL